MMGLVCQNLNIKWLRYALLFYFFFYAYNFLYDIIQGIVYCLFSCIFNNLIFIKKKNLIVLCFYFYFFKIYTNETNK